MQGNLTDKKDRFYSAIVLVNSTSMEITGSYASFLSIAFLKKYLKDNFTTAANEPFDPSKANFTYIHHPFPKDKLFASIAKA